jgi:hypothetical protein
MGMPAAGGISPAKLVPDAGIPGQDPAAAPGQPAQAQHGGPRLAHFNMGATEGLPGESAGGEGAAVGEAGAEVMAGSGPEDPITDVLAVGTLLGGMK